MYPAPRCRARLTLRHRLASHLPVIPGIRSEGAGLLRPTGGDESSHVTEHRINAESLTTRG